MKGLTKWILMIMAMVPLATAGCTSVKPWERSTLARTDMAWDPDGQQSLRAAHIFFSKEGSMPGGSAGGGGCGCN